jgi:hypothetical protein
MDPCMVNIYILWKLADQNNPAMLMCEIFFRKLAEDMYFYRECVDLSFRTRQSCTTARPSPGCRSAPATPSASLSMPFPGRSLATDVPIPKTRRGKKQMTAETYRHGTSDRNKLFRHYFICQRIAKRVNTPGPPRARLPFN